MPDAYNPLWSDTDSTKDDDAHDDGLSDDTTFSHKSSLERLVYKPDGGAFSPQSFLDHLSYDPIRMFNTTLDIFSTWTTRELDTARDEILEHGESIDKVNEAYHYLRYILILHLKYGFKISTFFTPSTGFQNAPEKLLEGGKKRKRTICEDLSEVKDRLSTIRENMKSVQEARLAIKDAQASIVEREEFCNQLLINIIDGERKHAQLQGDLSQLQKQLHEEHQNIEDNREKGITARISIDAWKRELERREGVLATYENGQEDRGTQISSLPTLLEDISKLID